jgi:creatinine amidohydrolase/Fe(II)-dependent formamide hydrolase-like protein
MDLVTGLGDAGFRWVFVFDVHGPAINQRITKEASQYFEDVYRGTMINLSGVVHPDPPAEDKPLTELEQEENGIDIHAGLIETSIVKFVQPDLVRPEYVSAGPASVNSVDDVETIANEEDWPGYFGSPRLARAELGEDRMTVDVQNASDLALRIIGGYDPGALAYWGEAENPALQRLDRLIIERSSRIEKQQDDWMRKKGIEE